VLAALLGDDGYPAGRLIMMLRVTFTGVSSLPEAGEGGTNAAASPAGSTRSTKQQVRSNGSAVYDGACVFFFFLRAAAVTGSLSHSPLILTAAGRTGCLRRRPSPVSGRGPATVSSHSLSRRPISLRRNHPTATARCQTLDLQSLVLYPQNFRIWSRRRYDAEQAALIYRSVRGSAGSP
jgi:hypothetical protein